MGVKKLDSGVVRGVKVMLDADLAEIYGYTTKAFNQQVKNNIEKFDADFRFQITKEEYHEILISKFLTSKLESNHILSSTSQNTLKLRSKNLTLELEKGKFTTTFTKPPIKNPTLILE